MGSLPMTLDIPDHPSLPSVRGKITSSAREALVLKVGEDQGFTFPQAVRKSVFKMLALYILVPGLPVSIPFLRL